MNEVTVRKMNVALYHIEAAMVELSGIGSIDYLEEAVTKLAMQLEAEIAELESRSK